jgi:membrane protease YdiL (CAAX protease family)
MVLPAGDHLGAGNVLAMPESDSGAPAPPPEGPPARSPGPAPDGFVPREWVETHHAHVRGLAAAAATEDPEGRHPAEGSPPAPPSPPPSALTARPAPGMPGMATMPPPPPANPDGPWDAAPFASPPPPPSLESSLGTPFLDTPWVPPTTKRQAGFWLLFGVIGFLVGQIGAVIFAAIGGAIAGDSSAQLQAIATASVPPEWYVIVTLLGLWIGFIGAPWIASFFQGTRHFFRDLGIRMKWIDLIGIPIGLAGQFLVVLMYAPFQHDIHDFNGPTTKLTGSAHGGGFVVIAIATIVFAPAMEELFFRGLLLKGLVRLFTPLVATGRIRVLCVVLAVIVDGLLFGLAHGEWVQLAGLAVFGMILAAISYRTGRLGMNFLAHATFNGVAILALVVQGSAVIH